MNKIFLALLVVPIISSCVYYKGMPSVWKKEIVGVTDCRSFNGTYELSRDNESLSDGYDYNDLRYFQNTRLYGHDRVVFKNLEKVKIKVEGAETTVTLYSGDKPVHKATFSKNSFECKENSLFLDLESQSIGGGLAAAYR